MIDYNKLKIGRCYKIGGRRPLVIMEYKVHFKGRMEISGYTPKRYEEYNKFNTLYKPEDKDYRTIAEVEGIEMPPRTSIRINSNCSFEEVLNFEKNN